MRLAVVALFVLLGTARAVPQASAQESDPVFFAVASGVVPLGPATPIWYAARLSLEKDDSIPDLAAGAPGFVLVTEGSISLVDEDAKQSSLLQPMSALFVPASLNADFNAIDGGATIWRIAMAPDDADPPIAQANGAPQPLVTSGESDPSAGADAVRSIELRLGVLPEGESLALGENGWAAPLVAALKGDASFDDGSSVSEGRIVARANGSTSATLTADTGDAVIGYVVVSPSLDPKTLGVTTGNNANSGVNRGNTGSTTTSAQPPSQPATTTDDTPPAPEPTTPPDTTDSDGDGLTDSEEATLGTNPDNPDTDVDGLSDGQEVHDFGSDPLLTDTDRDGLSDGDEVLKYIPILSPTSDDSDFDGLKDGDEVASYHTNPGLYDTDTDGIGDGDELAAGTDPLVLTDSDGDLLGDGLEAYYHTNPYNPDSDEDMLTDTYELFTTFTDPNLYDTDGDGTGDAVENASGTDPHDPNSHP
jgi:hypothetical protein